MTLAGRWTWLPVIAAIGLLCGCDTIAWWMEPANREGLPEGILQWVRSGVFALIAIPFVLYGIYKGSHSDRPGGGGG